MTKRSVRQLEQDQKVPLSYIGKVGVGIPVHNGGHVLGECVGNASSDGMKRHEAEINPVCRKRRFRLVL